MNVVFIVNDSFRRDHLGCYGSTRVKTPNLDKFAQHAAAFDQAYIASYPTIPNRWDLSTGRFGFPFRGWQPLDPADITWGQIMAEQGVHTQMIWDTPMLGVHNYNYTRGFSGWSFVNSQKGDPLITEPHVPIRLPAQPHKIKDINGLASYLRNHHGRKYEREYCVGRTFSKAMDWLETNHNHDSFFLWIDMWDPHEPFDCPWYDYQLYADPDYEGDRMMYPQYGRPTYMSEAEKTHTKALYAGSCTQVDRWVGQFMDTLEKLGLFENTLVIWTTDHGHLFGDHDLQGKPGAELGRLYEATTRIPLLVHHPDGLGAGKLVKGIVQPPDLLPSILEFLDMPVPSHVQGQSFWPLVTGGSGNRRDYAFSSRFPPGPGDASYTPVEGVIFDGWVGSGRIVEPSTVTDEEWAYTCAPAGRPSELYNLGHDPGQESNVIEENPEVAARMRRAWIEFLEEHGAGADRIRPFVEPVGEAHTPVTGKLYAFRDDLGQWIAFPTEREARAYAFREDAPGPRREVEEVSYGALLDDNPRNLIRLNGQYYWAEDLA